MVDASAGRDRPDGRGEPGEPGEGEREDPGDRGALVRTGAGSLGFKGFGGRGGAWNVSDFGCQARLITSNGGGDFLRGIRAPFK